MSLPQPMFDKVLIQPFMGPDESEGGILIPEVARKKTNSGLVVAVGPGKALTPHEAGPLCTPSMLSGNGHYPIQPMHVEVGDTVYFGEYFGHPIDVDGITYIVASEAELLAVEKPDKEA